MKNFAALPFYFGAMMQRSHFAARSPPALSQTLRIENRFGLRKGKNGNTTGGR